MSAGILIVGAGFAGSVIAERCAAAGKDVLLIDRRTHLGGNAFDEVDPQGVLVHRYGPHIFHTRDQNVASYLSRFTAWIPYEHRVRASLGGMLYPFPINRTTINQLYGLSLDDKGAADYLASVRVPCSRIETSQDAVLASAGSDLCEKFYRGYTRKQWGLDLSEMNAAVTTRIPIRTNADDRYFDDEFQCMPAHGFAAMFASMLDHPGIKIELGLDFQQLRQRLTWNTLVYTGPIDEFFAACYGALRYRSMRFEHQHLPGVQRYQSVGTVNFPNEHRYTRITEFKHLTGQQHPGTSIVREFPCEEGEPYYPMPLMECQALYQRYAQRAAAERSVHFVGRLAQYAYMNMDQVVARALKVSKEILGTGA